MSVPEGRGEHSMSVPGRLVLRACLGAGLALLSALSFAPAFGLGASDVLADAAYLPHMAAVTGLAALVCTLLHVGTGLAPVTRVLASLLALLAYVTLAIAPGTALIAGPRRLLTSALPVEPSGPELGAVALLAGLAALAAVEPALRGRAPVLQPLGPLAVTAMGCAASAAAGAPAAWLAPALAGGVAALLVVARYAPPPGDAPGGGTAPESGRVAERARRLLAVLVGGAVLAGVAAASWGGGAVVARAGRETPADARTLVEQPVRPREAVSPLVMYPALRNGTLDLSLVVRSATPPGLMRYVSLDRFDGEHWSSAARYRRAGRVLPPDPDGPPRTVSRDERVQVNDPGPLGWLVSSGRPTEVSEAGLGIDEATGDVVFPAGRPVPGEYRVRSAVPVNDPQELEQDVRLQHAAVPPLPADLTALARHVIGGEYGIPAMRRLQEYFAPPRGATDQGFRVDKNPKAPGGHGLYQIKETLKLRQGTPEQYASAFAVLARAEGYVTRVVVGFQPREMQPGVYVVKGKDVRVWAEVLFETAGWVPFDPTPRLSADSSSAAPPPAAATPSPEPKPTKSKDAAARPAPAPGGRTGTGTDKDDAWPPMLLAAAALAGLGGLYLAGVPGLKAWRRTRRRAGGSPRRRTLAAWHEVVDRLVESGLPVAAADTTGEVLTSANDRFGAEVGRRVGRLAALHGEAVFAPEPPAGATAEEAWHEADMARYAIRAALPRTRRWRAGLSPHPLRPARRARPGEFTPDG
ncbi:transglutaminase domain-containing protein [Actinomadura rubrisoli]|uniref:DUF4129 domain-containing protein n=1 Tax=Actinomadura rubrisoli TaxID=2530368 RepID=A0A4R5A717_9ACTN|nr:transglutaminase domain-containing protein [Actinomadura rubrisoli]TDD66579.1 DUF4129 domain-containing protein [Actinomadura rubrisoli]